LEGVPRNRSTRRWLIVSLAFGLLVGTGWYCLHLTSPHGTPLVAANPRAVPRLVAIADTRAVPRTESPKIRGTESVVCGVGAVRLDHDDRVASFNYVDRLTGAAQSRWRRTLLDSDDDHERAAGLLLQSEDWDYDRTTGMPSRTHDAQLARDELVQLADGLKDLPIYAMALRACEATDDGSARGGACERISLTEWAKMDSDNAAPWLEMAAAAHSRSDRSAEIEAVSHAVNAHTVNFYNDSLLAYASPGMPHETTGLERAAFFYRVIGHVGGDGFAHAFATASYCTAEGIKQSSIHQQCEALAEVLADHGRNTLDLSAAAAIGTRLGWSSDRIAAMHQELLAMFRVEAYSGGDPWSCDHVRALNDFAGIQLRLGELAAARAAIQKSGKSVAELAQEQTDFLQEE
jgi:hypothetical protein